MAFREKINGLLKTGLSVSKTLVAQAKANALESGKAAEISYERSILQKRISNEERVLGQTVYFALTSAGSADFTKTLQLPEIEEQMNVLKGLYHEYEILQTRTEE